MSQQEISTKEQLFSIRLKGLRLRKGIGQEELASKIGVSAGSVGNWEGKNPHLPQPQTLRKIAEFFGCEIGYLLGDEALKEEATPYTVIPSADEKGYRDSLRTLAKNKTRPELYLAEQVHKMLDEENPRAQNLIAARAGARELISVLDEMITKRQGEPSSTADDVSAGALKKAVESVKRPGVIYGRSRKAASTSDKTSSPASPAREDSKDQP